MQAELLPRAVRCAIQRAACIAPPVPGMLQLLRAAPVPAFGQPPLRLGIAAVLDEAQELGIAHGPLRDLAALHKHLVARALVVERKALAAMAHGMHATRHGLPLQRGRRSICRPRRRHALFLLSIGRPQRVARQQVLDVGQQQFLVLLFMLQAQLQQRGQTRRRLRAPVLEHLQHALVHRLAIGQHPRQRGPGQQPALGTRMPRTHLLVVGVEQHAEVGIEGRHAGRVLGQDKGLEEPGGMRQMPFGRAGIGHGLYAGILGGQGAASSTVVWRTAS